MKIHAPKSLPALFIAIVAVAWSTGVFAQVPIVRPVEQPVKTEPRVIPISPAVPIVQPAQSKDNGDEENSPSRIIPIQRLPVITSPEMVAETNELAAFIPFAGGESSLSPVQHQEPVYSVVSPSNEQKNPGLFPLQTSPDQAVPIIRSAPGTAYSSGLPTNNSSGQLPRFEPTSSSNLPLSVVSGPTTPNFMQPPVGSAVTNDGYQDGNLLPVMEPEAVVTNNNSNYVVEQFAVDQSWNDGSSCDGCGIPGCSSCTDDTCDGLSGIGGRFRPTGALRGRIRSQ
ncbi:MAG: hypothetical protein R3C03_16110 [Pirellulaceae bacterium]